MRVSESFVLREFATKANRDVTGGDSIVQGVSGSEGHWS